MKNLKLKTTQTILGLALLAFLLPACSQDQNTSSSATESNKMEIHEAVMYGNLNAVKELIEEGADLNVKEPMAGSTPLISAITFNHVEIAEALIEAGADPEIQNNDGSTALHAAAFFCRVEIVQMLIDQNANKNIKNNFGATPRESVMGPFAQVKPVYEMMQQQLGPYGLVLDLNEVEKVRPVISMMLQD